MLKQFGFKQGFIFLVGLLSVWLLQAQVFAQSPVNLQADVNRLRQEVSQLRAQISQLNRQGQSQPRNTAPVRVPASAGELTDREMLDRLAVLAIEAKDRLRALEQRVDRLEKVRR